MKPSNIDKSNFSSINYIHVKKGFGFVEINTKDLKHHDLQVAIHPEGVYLTFYDLEKRLERLQFYPFHSVIYIDFQVVAVDGLKVVENYTKNKPLQSDTYL